jgi:cysteinyl-tRNA synthetase
MLQIYNTLSRKKEEFKPITEGKVNMYVCGVTVYDYCHLGHARALIVFDLIYRYLCYSNYDVTFVRNFTDIDDKIINRSKEQGITWQELTQKFIQAFHEDTGALGLRKPTHEPLATDNIQGIIDIITKLEEKGLAYRVDNDVFYAVRKFEGYGKLSGKNIEDLAVGARVDVMEKKRDPLDFALWKGAKEGEPFWPSPWGDGRPGWHIECSAMSMRYLTESFDIHGGGRDLIFPHHENEIAQSEGCSHKQFSKYWVHNGFVNIDAEKMSKSLGNFLTIRNILVQYPGEVIRFFILSAHYRSPLDYTEQNILDAASGLERFYELKQRLVDYQGDHKDDGLADKVPEFKAGFEKSMNDDFNSARVIGQVFEWVRTLNKAIDEEKLSQQTKSQFLEAISNINDALGLFGYVPQDYFTEVKNKRTAANKVSPDEIEKLIGERLDARKNKDFKRADQIRDELAGNGVQLKDNPDGTTGWTII